MFLGKLSSLKIKDTCIIEHKSKIKALFSFEVNINRKSQLMEIHSLLRYSIMNMHQQKLGSADYKHNVPVLHTILSQNCVRKNKTSFTKCINIMHNNMFN